MPIEFKKTYLLLGSNLGNKEVLLESAVKQIEKLIGAIFAKSAIYETAAWGKIDQPSFLNLAIGVDTLLTPLELLNNILGIEENLGRIRAEKWGARLIDIDVILYGDEIINLGQQLIIPHVEMQNRKFVLQPLAEIAPNIKHPILNKTIIELLNHLNDSLPVVKR